MVLTRVTTAPHNVMLHLDSADTISVLVYQVSSDWTTTLTNVLQCLGLVMMALIHVTLIHPRTRQLVSTHLQLLFTTTASATLVI